MRSHQPKLRIWLSALILTITTLATAPSIAGNFYVTPEGAGDKSGRDWQNALAANQGGLQQAWNQLEKSGTVFIGSGTYSGVTMRLNSSGESAANPKCITGKDTGGGLPLFTSDFDKQKPASTGKTLFFAETDSSNWRISDLQINGYRLAIAMRGNHHHVTISGLTVTNSRDCFYIFGGASADYPNIRSAHLTIKDCNFKNYTKRAIRILNGYNFVKIINCHADAGGRDWATERFAIGYQCYSKFKGIVNNHITFIDCSSKNHWDPNGNKYWNADGFVMERDNRNVRYIRCLASGNTDGGWDDKSPNPIYIDCISIANKRNFRLWSNKGFSGSDLRPMLINCVSAYARLYGGTGTAAGFHASDGNNILLINCTLAYNPINIDLDDAYTPKERAGVELINTILLNTPENRQVTAEKNSEIAISGSLCFPAIDKQAFIAQAGPDSWYCTDTIITENPELTGADKNWTGKTPAFSSKKYPGIGYRGKAISGK